MAMAAAERQAPPFRVAVNRQVVNKSKDFEILATGFQNYALNQEQLAGEINKGHAFTTHHRGRRNQDNFTGGGYVALDFDQATPEQMVEILADNVVQNYFGIFYHTPSSKPDKPKFRILFQLEQPITDPEAYRKLVAAFIWRFSATADGSCKDPCRLFYGSQGSEPTWTGNVIPDSVVIDILQAHEQEQQYEENLKSQARKVSGSFNSENLNTDTKKKIFERILESHCARVRMAGEGNRHYTLIRSARALGGYLAGEPGATDEFEVRRRLEEAYSSHHGYNRSEMLKAIKDGLGYGGKAPLFIEALMQPQPAPRPDTPQPRPVTKKKAAVEVFDAADLMSRVFSPIKWVIPKLLPEGSTLCAARPKSGKSWMFLALAVAVAEGGRFMDAFDCEQGDVLYCALEDNARRLQDRMAILLDGRPVPKGLHFVLGVPKIGEGFIEWLTEFLEAHPNIRLVVIDTLSKIKPQKGKDESVYEADYKAGEGIKGLTDKYRFACVMVYHTRKAESEDPLEKVSGSYGLTGGVDNVWIIERKTNEGEGKLAITGRDIEEQDLAVTFNGSTSKWTCRGDAAMYGENAAREEVFAFFRERNNKPSKLNEIALALNKRNRNEAEALRQLLTRMRVSGRLQESANSLWSITHYVPTDPNQSGMGFF